MLSLTNSAKSPFNVPLGFKIVVTPLSAINGSSDEPLKLSPHLLTSPLFLSTTIHGLAHEVSLLILMVYLKLKLNVTYSMLLKVF